MTARHRRRGSPDAALPVLRALLAGAPGAELVDMASTGWASATFVGARHVIRLCANDDAAVAAWLAGLPDAQFRLGGHLMVDIAVTGVERRDGRLQATIEALTVEDA